jgi:hypothetical protein
MARPPYSRRWACPARSASGPRHHAGVASAGSSALAGAVAKPVDGGRTRSRCWRTGRCGAKPLAAAPPARPVDRRLVGGDLDGRDLGRPNRVLEEPAGCPCVPTWGDEHIDDLAELVDRAVDVAPLASDLHVGLVDLPAVTDGVAAGPSGVRQQWREAQHPAVDGDVVDLDAPLDQEFLDIAVGQPEAQVLADREHSHPEWEAEANNGGARSGSRAWAAGSHASSLTAGTRSQPTQQSSRLYPPPRRTGGRGCFAAFPRQSCSTVGHWYSEFGMAGRGGCHCFGEYL